MHKLKQLMASGLVWLWLAVVVIIIDRFSKYWVVKNLLFLAPMKILPIFNFTLAFNTGAAFSFLDSASGWQNWAFSGLALLVSGIIIVWLSTLKKREYCTNLALCLILAGALGNAWDRLLYGYVIDFLDFHWGDWHFAIFNVADSAICLGAFMLIWCWATKRTV